MLQTDSRHLQIRLELKHVLPFSKSRNKNRKVRQSTAALFHALIEALSNMRR